MAEFRHAFMDAAVIIVHRLVPRVYAQDTVIFEQAGLKVSLERIPSPLWGTWAPGIRCVQGEIGTAFYIIASGQAAWKQKD